MSLVIGHTLVLAEEGGSTLVRGIITLSSVILLVQAGQVGGTTGWSVTQVGQFTLTGALILAVGVLWRWGLKKDEIILRMAKSVTEALTLATSSNAELRAIIAESVRAKDALRESIDELRITLGKLPCTMDYQRTARQG